MITVKDRNEKMEKILSTIAGHREKEAAFRKITDAFKGMSEEEFKSLAGLCPGRSAEESYRYCRGMRYDCDCGPVYCEYEKCPMVQEDVRFNWEDEDDASN